MANENLIPMTVRLDSVVNAALALKANASGQEVADYAADVLMRDVKEELKRLDPGVADRIQAELELKKEAIAYAKDRTAETFYEDITFKVFAHIRENDRLRELYERAIGGRPGTDRGNHIKARINRAFGAAIKTALGAIPKIVNGHVQKGEVPAGEFIRSYTLLEPNTAKKRGT